MQPTPPINQAQDANGNTYDALQTAATVNFYNSDGKLINSLPGSSIQQKPAGSLLNSILQLPNPLNTLETASVNSMPLGSVNQNQSVGAPSWNSYNPTTEIIDPKAGFDVVWGNSVTESSSLTDSFLWNGSAPIQSGASGGGTWIWINGQLNLVGTTIQGAENRWRSSLEPK